jgi:hypothetical protein
MNTKRAVIMANPSSLIQQRLNLEEKLCNRKIQPSLKK